MYNNSTKGKKRDGRASGRDGNKRFGGGGFKRRDPDSRGDFKPMHKATCAECNSNCEVPFKPNGRKPVLCSDCFKKSDDRPSPNYSSRERRPECSERPSYDRGSDFSEQLNKINAKLDTILRMMED